MSVQYGFILRRPLWGMASDDDVRVLLGDPRKAVKAMAIPLLISLLVAELNSIADRVWCSGLGSDALATIAVVVPIYLVLSGLGNGLGVGGAAVVARFIGAGDRDSACGCALNAAVFSLVFGLLLLPILLPTMDPILSVIGSEDINGLASDYMLYIVLMSPILILNGTMAGLLRGEGAARMAKTMVLITAVVNIVLDPLFIYILDMGVAGASLATLIATSVSTLFGLSLYLRGMTYIHMSIRGFRFNRRHLGTVLAVGVPQMLEYTVMYAMNVVLNLIVIMCAGSVGLTIYTVPNSIMELAVIPAMAIGSALVPVASSAYGQRNTARISEAYRYSLKTAVGVVALLVAVVFVVPEPFLYMFTYTPEMEALRGQMVEAMRIYCLFLPFYAAIPVCSGLLQSIMMPNRSVWCAVVRNILLIILYWIAAQYSLTAIFWAVFLGEVIGGLMIYAVARRSYAVVSCSLDYNKG